MPFWHCIAFLVCGREISGLSRCPCDPSQRLSVSKESGSECDVYIFALARNLGLPAWSSLGPTDPHRQPGPRSQLGHEWGSSCSESWWTVTSAGLLEGRRFWEGGRAPELGRAGGGWAVGRRSCPRAAGWAADRAADPLLCLHTVAPTAFKEQHPEGRTEWA